LFERHSRVIDPAAIHKIHDAFRTLGPELSWHGVDNQASLVFRLLCGCYVHQCPNKFDLPRLVPDRVTYDSYVLDGTVLHQQSMLKIKIFLFLRAAFDGLFHKHDVFWMNPLQYRFQCGFRLWVAFENSKRLVGPTDFSALNTPAKAAGVGESLRLR
jgi:hypothetical protein